MHNARRRMLVRTLVFTLLVAVIASSGGIVAATFALDTGPDTAFSAARAPRERLFHVDVTDGGRVTYSYRPVEDAWVVVSVTESPPIVERQWIP